MRINIVCYEDPEAWICGKIARRLCAGVQDLGHACAVTRTIDVHADINHHVIYLNYNGSGQGVHTLMVTHIDDALKLKKLQQVIGSATAAICMSAQSANRLKSLGVDQNKLTFVNPAHDEVGQHRRIVVGITTRLYPDGRKRESDFVRLCLGLSPADFTFKIMGFGWETIVSELRNRGFKIEYHQEFDYERYIGLIATLDYFLYLGDDEGSMGFVDALAAGVKTIVQPQGFHLDAPDGISHAFSNYYQLVEIFEKIAAEKRKRQSAVSLWTWSGYAAEHLKIWNCCLRSEPFETSAGVSSKGDVRAFPLRFQLWARAFKNRAAMVMNMGRDFDCDSRFWRKRRDRAKLKNR